MDLIPEDCLSLLPFTPEAMTSWTYRSDAATFLRYILDKVSGSRFDRYIFRFHKRRLLRVGKRFERAARELDVPFGADEHETCPVLRDDPYFGLAAKYSVGWEGVCQALMEESGFFSIAHIMEGTTELRCSFLLAEKLYYKQALQVLRNYLELCVMDLHFSTVEEAYSRWKAGDYRVPPFRGKEGLLAMLRAQGALSENLCAQADRLYGELNGSIHSAEGKLINHGVFSRNWTGQVFQYQRFQKWCQSFASCVDLGIQLEYQIASKWAKARDSRLVCDICHNTDLVSHGAGIADNATIVFVCRECGSQQAFSREVLEALRPPWYLAYKASVGDTC